MQAKATGPQSPIQSPASEATAFAYLIRHPESGLYKIGRSVNPAVRLTTLGPKAAALELVATIPTASDVWLERTLHEAFAHRRVKGEWFRLAEEEIGLFASIPRADCLDDMPAAVQALREANAANRFATADEGRPEDNSVPSPPDDGRVACSMRLHPASVAALDAAAKRTRAGSRVAVIEAIAILSLSALNDRTMVPLNPWRGWSGDTVRKPYPMRLSARTADALDAAGGRLSRRGGLSRAVVVEILTALFADALNETTLALANLDR